MILNDLGWYLAKTRTTTGTAPNRAPQDCAQGYVGGRGRKGEKQGEKRQKRKEKEKGKFPRKPALQYAGCGDGDPGQKYGVLRSTE